MRWPWRRVPRYRPAVRALHGLLLAPRFAEAVARLYSRRADRWIVVCDCPHWEPMRCPDWQTAYLIADDHARVAHKTDQKWVRR